MAQNNDRIIICEKCFNIPQIIILNAKNIQLFCNNCNETIIKDYHYFDKFLNKNKEEKLFDLEKCNFNKDHQTKAIIYCFKCSKNLCNECIKIHDSYMQGTDHITLPQKIKHQYFCQDNEHKEFPLDRYCTECNNYLCSHCKHNHDKKNLYIFEDNNKNNKDIIKEIKKKLKIVKR